MEIKDLFNRYTLDWHDEFDYEGRPDPEKWDFEVGNHQWHNNELQAYTDRPENAFVSGGRLHIVALKKQDGEREYTSARMVTCGKREFTKGLFEIRCKLPKGQGSWPFDEPHFLICNIAVGGTMGGQVDDSTLPYEMEVAHIRYYKPKN